MNYQEMAKAAIDRAVKAGFGPGTRVRNDRRAGIVSGVNPFCYDMADMPVYVDLDQTDRYPARRGVSISMSSLEKL